MRLISRMREIQMRYRNMKILSLKLIKERLASMK